jgi:hypothetical protein
MKIWLDDIRIPPDSTWTWCKTAEEAIGTIFVNQEIQFISFDHDLGEGASGYRVAVFLEFMASLGYKMVDTWDIHSANPVGRKNIQNALENANRFLSEIAHEKNR